ncbi:hypothetical protein C8J57DRAFT_1661738, partial [Mycena rebaudengoi]
HQPALGERPLGVDLARTRACSPSPAQARPTPCACRPSATRRCAVAPSSSGNVKRKLCELLREAHAHAPLHVLPVQSQPYALAPLAHPLAPLAHAHAHPSRPSSAPAVPKSSCSPVSILGPPLKWRRRSASVESRDAQVPLSVPHTNDAPHALVPSIANLVRADAPKSAPPTGTAPPTAPPPPHSPPSPPYPHPPHRAPSSPPAPCPHSRLRCGRPRRSSPRAGSWRRRTAGWTPRSRGSVSFLGAGRGRVPWAGKVGCSPIPSFPISLPHRTRAPPSVHPPFSYSYLIIPLHPLPPSIPCLHSIRHSISRILHSTGTPFNLGQLSLILSLGITLYSYTSYIYCTVRTRRLLLLGTGRRGLMVCGLPHNGPTGQSLNMSAERHNFSGHCQPFYL